MSDKSAIEWTATYNADGSITPGSTWNPVTGCHKVSPGCEHCYAETFAERWRGIKGHHFEHGFDLTLRPDKLDLPLRWRKPRKIFVTSMGDLFHKDVPDDFILKVFDVMRSCHVKGRGHIFQILTKRPERMADICRRMRFDGSSEEGRMFLADDDDKAKGYPLMGGKPGSSPLPNVWLGTSVENQKTADTRIPHLLATPAAVRFLSCEPLLGPLDLEAVNGWHYPFPNGQEKIHWVIAGGESGPRARPMHPAWARAIRDQCVKAGVPFFFKQWGAWADLTDVENPHAIAKTHDIKTAAGELLGVGHGNDGMLDGAWKEKGGAWMGLVGKKKAGRTLDGRTWDEFPKAAA